MVIPNDASGTRGHLTPLQTRILYKLWQRFFRLCETPAGHYTGSTGQSTASTSAHSSVPPSAGGEVKPSPCSSSGEKQAGPSSPSRHHHQQSASTSTSNQNLIRTISSQSGSYGRPIQRQPSRIRQIDERGNHIPKDDKVKDELKTIEEAKEMKEFLEKYGGEKLREIFWDMVKGEHPDAIMLRFLRARKWDIDRAIAVIGSTAAFRADNDVKGIVKGGELQLTRTRGGRNLFANGISYVYGASSIGEPVYFIEVGNHFSHNQTQEELKKGVILLQEWLQMLMPPPIESKVVIFNMNDFGLRNMDWWVVFFMVKTMESYYVETLARVYVHGAPWIFRPIWAILKPLLDPVVRDKIRLTSSPEELADHIPFDHLPKGSMRGGMDWEFEYSIPDEHENDIQLDVESHDRLAKVRDDMAIEFEKATKEICNLYARSSMIQRARDGAHQDMAFDSDSEDVEDVNDGLEGISGGRRRSNNGVVGGNEEVGEDLKAKRDLIATRLRVAFLKLRPYIVGTSTYTRWNVHLPDGSIHWEYTNVNGEKEEQTLGLGTTLPELERNLEMIDSAAQMNINSLSDSMTRQSLEMSNGGGGGGNAREEAVKESNRQKRLRNRAKSPDLDHSSSSENNNNNNNKAADEQPNSLLIDGQSNAASSSTVTAGKGVNQITPTISQTTTATTTAEEEKEDSKPVPVHPLQEHSRSIL